MLLHMFVIVKKYCYFIHRILFLLMVPENTLFCDFSQFSWFERPNWTSDASETDTFRKFPTTFEIMDMSFLIQLYFKSQSVSNSVLGRSQKICNTCNNSILLLMDTMIAKNWLSVSLKLHGTFEMTNEAIMALQFLMHQLIYITCILFIHPYHIIFRAHKIYTSYFMANFILHNYFQA